MVHASAVQRLKLDSLRIWLELRDSGDISVADLRQRLVEFSDGQDVDDETLFLTASAALSRHLEERKRQLGVPFLRQLEEKVQRCGLGFWAKMDCNYAKL